MSENSDAVILREYLVALGFKVDNAAKQRFGSELSKLDRTATSLGKSFAGVGLAAAAMVGEFSLRMERLYYASKLAQSTAGSLQAIDFAGRQAGVDGLIESVKTFARELRLNPGKKGLLEYMGIKVDGREMTDVFKDFVKATKKMPDYVAAQYAGLFGIDPDKLKLLQMSIDQIEQNMRMRAQLAKDLGIDTEKAAEAGKEYAQQWREILMTVGLFKDALALTMLGPMRTLAAATKEILQDWVRIVQMPRDKFLADMRLGLGLDDAGGGVHLTPEAQRRLDGANKEERDKARQQGAIVPRQWQDMDDEERIRTGRANRNLKGEVVPDWDALTKGERRYLNMPESEDQLPWYERAYRAMGKPIERAKEYYFGSGGVELSREAKERTGRDKFDSDSGSRFDDFAKWARDSIGYKSLKKTPTDEAAVSATARAPEIERSVWDERLKQQPELRPRIEEAQRKGDFNELQRLYRALKQPAQAQGAERGKTPTMPSLDEFVDWATKPEPTKPAEPSPKPGSDKKPAAPQAQPGITVQPPAAPAPNVNVQVPPTAPQAQPRSKIDDFLAQRPEWAPEVEKVRRSGSIDDMARLYERMVASTSAQPQGAQAAAPQQGAYKAQPPSESQSFLSRLESMYALPRGLMDRVWSRESNRSDPKHMKSSAGAEGPFQFMPDTAKDYGLKNSYDFKESGDASARYYRDLLKKYAGDVQLAAAGYNWGPSKVDALLGKFGARAGEMSADTKQAVLGALPRETRDYVAAVAPGQQGGNGATINQTNNITVHGAGKPQETASAIGGELREVNADVVRNMTQRVY